MLPLAGLPQAWVIFGGGWRRPWGYQGSNSHCGQGPAETGGFWASDLQTGLMSWLESGPGVALVWLWCGLGVALGWPWGGFVLRSLCLVYAYNMALGWLWVALGGFARSLCPSYFPLSALASASHLVATATAGLLLYALATRSLARRRFGRRAGLARSKNASCLSSRTGAFLLSPGRSSSRRSAAKSKSVRVAERTSDKSAAERSAQAATRNSLITITRRSFAERTRPQLVSRRALAAACLTASRKAARPSAFCRLSTARLRHTSTTSSWMGSFACDFGAATDISDLSG